MEDYNFTQKKKRDAVIVAICANDTDLEISNFLKCPRPLAHKVRYDLKASSGDAESVATFGPCPTCNIHSISASNHGQGPFKLNEALGRELNVSDGLIHGVVHEDLRYKSYVMRRRQFMLEQTQEQRVIQSKHLLKKIKYAEAPEMLWVFSDE